MMIPKLSHMIAAMLAISVCSAASAQDSNEQQNSQKDRQQQQNQSQQQKDSQQKKKQPKESDSEEDSQDSQTQSHLKPIGWVTIGADYNNDGFYDAFETIYYYDFEQAKKRSKERSQQNGQSQASRDQSSQSSGQQSNKSQKQLVRRSAVQGTISELKTMKSADGQKKNLAAHVKTSNGKFAVVCLGPEQSVSKLNLEQGDRISADGVLTQMHGKPVLLAAKVKANGQSVQHKLTRRKGINRVQGEIVGLQEATSRRGDGQFIVANIETDNGTQQVHLGPQKQLQKLNLSVGEDVNIVTREGQVRGKSALIALQVQANDKTVDVIRPRSSSQSDSGNRSKSQNRDRDSDDSDDSGRQS